LRNHPAIISTEASPTGDDVSLEETLEGESRAWEIAMEQHGERLDRALSQLVPEFSRNYLQQLIVDGAVTCQGQVLSKPAARMKVGQQGQIELRPTPQSQAFVAQAIALDVVFEDAHLLVLNKPAGLVVHPAPGNWSGTLLNALLHRYAKAAQLPRAGIVHRLDKDTSGLMVVAKTRATMDALVQLIAAREVKRQYLALAHRPLDVEAAIGRDPRQRLRMAVVEPQRGGIGKPARTTFDLLHNTADACCLRCTLHTGRTHQIRVHAAHLGHPLLGDALYGGSMTAGIARQALHAWRLAFSHPVTGQSHVWKAVPPPDFLAVLDRWGVGYNELTDEPPHRPLPRAARL
jgi:23S rRNA pseudouridine1911/1915/1917 synthase